MSKETDPGSKSRVFSGKAILTKCEVEAPLTLEGAVVRVGGVWVKRTVRCILSSQIGNSSGKYPIDTVTPEAFVLQAGPVLALLGGGGAFKR
jgi:hypothetical protein